MGIRDNGGGGGAGGARSGGRIGAGKNCGVLGGLIFEGDGLVGSFITSVVAHIVGL